MTERLGLSAAGMVLDEPKAVLGVGSLGGRGVEFSFWLEGRHTGVVLSIQAVSRAERQYYLPQQLSQVIAVARANVLARRLPASSIMSA